jgi:hypothetical protein
MRGLVACLAVCAIGCSERALPIRAAAPDLASFDLASVDLASFDLAARDLQSLVDLARPRDSSCPPVLDCLPRGAGCCAPNDCCSFLCADGICANACAALGQSCNVASDCCTDYCSNGLCSAGP